GPTPASFGQVFAADPLAAGSRDLVLDADAQGKLRGIVSIDPEGDAAQLRAVVISVAGRCQALRDLLAATWGTSADGAWLDTAHQRRAVLDPDPCAVRIERYAEVDDWIADTTTAVVPLGVLGTPAKATFDRLARAHEVRSESESVQWNDVGIGR